MHHLEACRMLRVQQTPKVNCPAILFPSNTQYFINLDKQLQQYYVIQYDCRVTFAVVMKH